MNNTANIYLKPEILKEIALRRRWFLIIPFCLAMIFGIFLTIVLPKTYTASTLILVQPQRVPSNYVQSTVTEELNDRIRTISQQILSRTNLQKIIETFELFNDEESKNLLFSDKINSLRKRISIDVTRGRGRGGDDTAAFTISFKGGDPQLVARVTDTLARYFIDENLKVREAQAIGTSSFLEDELTGMRQRLETVEKKLKEYRELHMGGLPEQLDSNLRILERFQEQLTDARQRLNDARARLVGLQSREPLPALSTPPEAGSVGESLDPDQLRAELEQLKTRYTSRHPDVIRLEKMIADLEAGGRQGTGPTRRSRTAAARTSNLTSASVRQQQADTRREIGLIESEIAQTQAQIQVYQSRIEDTPKREQELLSLRRDYENIQTNYNSLLERKLEAELAVNLERKQKGEQFQIIDPAIVPEKPTDPDMGKLFLLVVAAGLGVGVGIVFLLEYFDGSFRLPEDVEAFLGLSVLGTIPAIQSPIDKTRQTVNNIFSIAFVLFASGLFAVFGAMVTKGVEPTLDFVKGFIPF